MTGWRILFLTLAGGAALATVAMAADVPAPAPADGVHYLYLIRHGDYDYDDGVDEIAGSGLNALGREQTRLLGARLSALSVRFDAVITSPYRRARETAGILAPMLDRTPVVDTLIHECTPATERADIMRDTTPEEVAACESNLETAWGKYAVPTPATDRRDVLVCHGNVIRWIVTRALGADRLHWLRMDIANASITVIAIRADGSVKLATFSDTGHMQPDGQSWTGRGAGWGEAKEK